MKLSLCIPVMGRTDDLRQTLSHTIKAAKAGPPVEIVVLDYDSKDDLAEYIKTIDYPITYKKSPNHEFFSISHSRNLSVLASRGDYIMILDADITLHEDFVQVIRAEIEREAPTWMVEYGRFIHIFEHLGTEHKKYTAGRMLICKREEFIMAGGYDERFNLCGPEDKDICMRLHRRGGKFVAFNGKLVDEVRTRQHRKIENLDKQSYEDALTDEQKARNVPSCTKYAMQLAMRKIYEENMANKTLVANEGGLWGQ